MINKNLLIEWKKRVIMLDYADYEVERKFNAGKITKKERKEIEKELSRLWIEVWDYYPHGNESIKQSFKLNFG